MMMRNGTPGSVNGSRRFMADKSSSSFQNQNVFPQKPTGNMGINMFNEVRAPPLPPAPEDQSLVKRISCYYCGAHFITKPGLKQHIREKCDRKNFMHCQSCHDCGDSFEDFEHYRCHLVKTRHMTHRADPTTEFPAKALLHSNNAMNSDMSSVTLYIGCSVQKNSLVGACSWELHSNQRIQSSIFSPYNSFDFADDFSTTVVAEGFKIISMEIPCMYRLAYESLILGISAAIKLKIPHITIKLDSELIVYQLASPRSLFFSTLHYNYRFLIQEIHRLLSHFRSCKFQLLKNNSFSPKSSFSAPGLSGFSTSLSSTSSSSESTSSSGLSCCEEKAEAALDAFDVQVTNALIERVSRPDLFWKKGGTQDED